MSSFFLFVEKSIDRNHDISENDFIPRSKDIFEKLFDHTNSMDFQSTVIVNKHRIVDYVYSSGTIIEEPDGSLPKEKGSVPDVVNVALPPVESPTALIAIQHSRDLAYKKSSDPPTPLRHSSKSDKKLGPSISNTDDYVHATIVQIPEKTKSIVEEDADGGFSDFQATEHQSSDVCPVTAEPVADAMDISEQPSDLSSKADVITIANDEDFDAFQVEASSQATGFGEFCSQQEPKKAETNMVEQIYDGCFDAFQRASTSEPVPDANFYGDVDALQGTSISETAEFGVFDSLSQPVSDANDIVEQPMGLFNESEVNIDVNISGDVGAFQGASTSQTSDFGAFGSLSQPVPSETMQAVNDNVEEPIVSNEEVFDAFQGTSTSQTSDFGAFGSLSQPVPSETMQAVNDNIEEPIGLTDISDADKDTIMSNEGDFDAFQGASTFETEDSGAFGLLSEAVPSDVVLEVHNVVEQPIGLTDVSDANAVPTVDNKGDFDDFQLSSTFETTGAGVFSTLSEPGLPGANYIVEQSSGIADGFGVNADGIVSNDGEFDAFQGASSETADFGAFGSLSESGLDANNIVEQPTGLTDAFHDDTGIIVNNNADFDAFQGVSTSETIVIGDFAERSADYGSNLAINNGGDLDPFQELSISQATDREPTSLSEPTMNANHFDVQPTIFSDTDADNDGVAFGDLEPRDNSNMSEQIHNTNGASMSKSNQSIIQCNSNDFGIFESSNATYINVQNGSNQTILSSDHKHLYSGSLQSEITANYSNDNDIGSKHLHVEQNEPSTLPAAVESGDIFNIQPQKNDQGNVEDEEDDFGDFHESSHGLETEQTVDNIDTNTSSNILRSNLTEPISVDGIHADIFSTIPSSTAASNNNSMFNSNNNQLKFLTETEIACGSSISTAIPDNSGNSSNFSTTSNAASLMNHHGVSGEFDIKTNNTNISILNMSCFNSQTSLTQTYNKSVDAPQLNQEPSGSILAKDSEDDFGDFHDSFTADTNEQHPHFQQTQTMATNWNGMSLLNDNNNSIQFSDATDDNTEEDDFGDFHTVPVINKAANYTNHVITSDVKSNAITDAFSIFD